jgi:transposase
MLSPPNFILLSAQDKDALIVRLLARLEALERENAALRERLNLPPKTPDNSSTPPAAGHKSNGETTRRPKGKPHAGAHRPLHPNPSRCRAVPASQCQHCGANVSGVVQTPVHSYDRIEIPEIKPDVTRVTLLGGLCPCCAKPFKAAPPAGLEPGSPFGPNLRAFAIYLRFTQAISFERLSQLFSDLLGLEISEGAFVNMLDDSKLAFARAASLIRARLLAAQMNWARKDHQVCLAHLIRDAQYAIDAGDTAFAPGLRKLLRRACKIGGRRHQLADATLRAYAYKLDTELDVLLRIAPAHGGGNKLQGVITGCRRHMFVFLANRAIPPTNNGSEQALRPCVIFRKVTNCFRSEWAAHLYADIRSVIETGRRKAIGALDAIRLTLNGLPLPAGPALRTSA